MASIAPTSERPADSAGAATTALDLAARFAAVRAFTNQLAAPLSAEDACVQSMPDASPTKWHLAHTTWFFETFVLEPNETAFEPFDPMFRILFNSYYNSIGEQHPRAHRGDITRPPLSAIRDYRHAVDARIAALLERGVPDKVARTIEVGLHHEQQHQELILMDIKHLLSRNPTWPCYQPASERAAAAPLDGAGWLGFDGGLVETGAADGGFAFDNERPRHQNWLRPFELAERLVTNAEYLEFVRAGGYSTPTLWLADGWATLSTQNWNAPLYWSEADGEWFEFTLHGRRPLALDAPVVHVSYYEADAYARWRDVRLPLETEWERASAAAGADGAFVEGGILHPCAAAAADGGLRQLFGDVWEWTMSAYSPYPGFRAPAGAIGEYNGKFMSNQMVLRGGCCATSRSHVRATYRNFFYPGNRWQFGGIRLARDSA